MANLDVSVQKPSGRPLVQARWVALKGHLVAMGYNSQDVNNHFGTGSPLATTDVQLSGLMKSFLKEYSNA